MDHTTFQQDNGLAIRKEDIAVIGMAARFPGASNYEEFWKNLEAAKSNVQEVPESRWDWKAYWGDPKSERNRSNSKWGGFLENIESFDADFFGLSAREVERMDPQQRIMLEIAWSCLEDAAIRPSTLSGSKVGVFLGVFNFDYKELQERNNGLSIEAHHSTGTASAIIANRVSYYFNFKGPSIPIDTACSSSLNAIHAAVQSLIQGECTHALAGGINLLLTPTRHISFSKTGMLSPTGACKTFDDSADGYVRGEGGGLVLLKPLQQALRDNNSICGIIKGSAVNHSGKTYSLTYPNPEAQKEVIIEAQKAAGVTADQISYVEAHGTGTPKGDPIEFTGLASAFESHVAEKTGLTNYCGLGSVKTNVGHLEAAAGIAGVIKVLLSMRYKQLAGLQNFTKLNHRISLENSPFYLVTKLREWEPLRDKNNKALPRIAGVSSFGFGGTNAHVVIQEPPSVKEARMKGKVPYYLICISAKTPESLLQKKKDLIAWLESISHVRIADVAKSLALGREHFQERSVVIAENPKDLLEKLLRLVKNETVAGCFNGVMQTKKNGSVSQLFIETGDIVVQALLSDKKITKENYYAKLEVLAELYFMGHPLDWHKPWFGSEGKVISLPTYPFVKKNHWIPDQQIEERDSKKAEQRLLHPLLGQNISSFQKQSFSTLFSEREFFIRDHVIKGKKILPGVAYLEMVRAALAESMKGLIGDHHSVILKNVVWSQPVMVEENDVRVNISLFAEEENLFSFEITSESENRPVKPLIHSQGITCFNEAGVRKEFLLEDLKKECDQKMFLKEQCYSYFGHMGFNYGPSHQSLEVIYGGDRQLLAKLKLPAAIGHTCGDYFLHPSMMDGALQAALTGMQDVDNTVSPQTYLPFALDFLEIIMPCTTEMWAVVRFHIDEFSSKKPTRRVDVDLCDTEGKVCVCMKGLTFKSLESGKFQSEDKSETMLIMPDWRDQTANADYTPVHYALRIVILCEPENISIPSMESQFPGIRFISLQSSQKNTGERFLDCAEKVFGEIRSVMKGRTSEKALVQIVAKVDDNFNLLCGLSGFLKTAFLENPNVRGQLIEIYSWDQIKVVLMENGLPASGDRVRFVNGAYQVLGWKEIENKNEIENTPWKDNGVYLITGGTGGLGYIFASEITKKAKNTSLVLTGRSALNDKIQSQISTLRATGARVDYRQADVSNKGALNDLIEFIKNEFNGLNGIVHSAGIVKDNFVIRKSNEELVSVLSPKVLGVTYLDELTKEIPLDIFVLFSSVVGPLGNTGQADYAVANAYLDGYAQYRNSLVKKMERSGHTLSVNWPLWRDGGMQLKAETQTLMLERMRMSLLETPVGIASLYHAIASGASQVLVASGYPDELRNVFLPSVEEIRPVLVESSSNDVQKMNDTARNSGAGNNDISAEQAIQYFKELLSTAIKRPVAQIDAEARMEQYGIDSIMIMQMTNRMEAVFGTLPKTLFFEFQSIKELTNYFLENHSENLANILVSEKVSGADEAGRLQQHPSGGLSFERNKLQTPLQATVRHERTWQATDRKSESSSLDIAIIGVAGRYPQANNLQEFWGNLKSGKDCITEIPKERWDYRLYFDEDKEQDGKSYSKWGGFINDVDKFDPLFFNITPLEAERMDPQERLFLQCVYETIEDAGYTRQTIGSQIDFGLGKQVGVYVGVMYEEYQLFGAQEALNGRPVALWGLPSSIANRVSYFCDFHGPSMAIDTMCSSSLTAIHLACESIARGKCEVAVAGGVNVSVHPNKYLFLSQGRFASSKGRCESFGIGGDGYVPGEGVGAVLLKPLASAIADGDNIYGIIKSTALNHGGKTNGYTVPNPKAQAGVINNALKEAGIDPRAISYLEAHGTGTSLGDPVEILGLSKAFREYTDDVQFCAIGSAKSNIGHCESAAGIAGVTKVLLQLKHKQIVPSLHSETLNANIDFKNSPFVVQQTLTEWKRPVTRKNETTTEHSRIAGISSFGAGGANAHIIIQEYIPPVPHVQAGPVTKLVNTSEPAIILLSAKDENRLKEKANQLSLAIRNENNGFWLLSDSRLHDIAYTLQVGREHMESRLALLVTSVDELKNKLQSFLSGAQKTDGLFHGEVSAPNDVSSGNSVSEETIKTWHANKNYSRIVEQWVNGLKVNWNELTRRDSPAPKRLSLPTYPFRKERYWVGDLTDRIENSEPENVSTSIIHPLLHRNISDFTCQRFSVTFSGNEFYLRDHIVNGNKILPAAAYLEMIREAVWQSVKALKYKFTDIQLQSIHWTQPCIVGSTEAKLMIELVHEEDGTICFEVIEHTEADPGNENILCRGIALIEARPDSQVISESKIISLQKQCNVKIISKESCYGLFKKIGLDYGPAHRCLEEVHIGHNRILAKAISSVENDVRSSFILHPGMTDSALQATLLWNCTENNDSVKLFLPVAVEKMEIYRNTPLTSWIAISNRIAGPDAAERLLDVEILAENGEVCVRMLGVLLKEPSSKVLAGQAAGNFKTFLLIPEWEKKQATQKNSTEFTKQYIIAFGLEKRHEEMLQQIPAAGFIAGVGSSADDFATASSVLFTRIQNLVKAKEKGNILVQVVVPQTKPNFGAIAGILRTAGKENPRFFGQVISIGDSVTRYDLEKIVSGNDTSDFDHEVRYNDGAGREVLRWKIPDDAPINTDRKVESYPWKDGGIYLITGGAGGLGLIMANEIVQTVKNITLVLTGRTPLGDKRGLKISALEKPGVRIIYKQADVANENSVRQLVQYIFDELGELNGIIHSAGVVRDNFVIQKTTKEWNEVMDPKVNGVQHLDLATSKHALDFFVLFSSVTGALGNIGQADYATANAFMDKFAAYRNDLVAMGKRRGHTVSLNWPLWKEGGMHVDHETENYLFESMGIIPLPTRSAIAAFYQAFQTGLSQVMIVEGDVERIYKKIVLKNTGPGQMTESIQPPSDGQGMLPEVINYFRKFLSSEVKLPIDKIKPGTSLEEYGIDSVMVMKMTGKLEKIFGTLSKTLFFEYQNIRELASYFLEEHYTRLASLLGVDDMKGIAEKRMESSGKMDFSKQLFSNNRRILSVRSSNNFAANGLRNSKDGEPLDIAIVGLSGKYPQADDLDQFWENLCQGKNSVTEIPKERWDYQLYFDSNKNKTGTTYSKWGGFLSAVDEFDPLLFNISPQEAELMDPQERLFLQCAYETLEDAGYNREALSKEGESGLGGNIGVYVGVMYEEYQLFGAQESMKGRNIALFGNPSSVANRVSYFYNFNGPSMAVDTMCSSSLTAIHLACQSIMAGDCKAAIAGGVNISIHPNKYLLLAQGKFISSKGQCESFGVGGDGYVPGEGVGAVFLKPLSQAIADGDHIYGLIKATAVNHGGKTNGYTVPNPNAQARVIKKAYQRAGIDPRTVSYIEAHGTGTSLGDPIEITGLKKAFQEYTADSNYCAIGSVKSNIGHGESAAGIAGLTKVLLQLKHKTLVPSLHARELNPNIDFANSPFVVQQDISEWKRPVVGQNGQAREFTRRAGISSFGAGGSNAHIVIEEHVFSNNISDHVSGPNDGMQREPAIILLSARNESRLKELVEKLVRVIQSGRFSDADLHSIAFTLQNGRDALETRLAVIVKSLHDLIGRLESFLKNASDVENLYNGRIERDNTALEAFASDESLQEAVEKWMKRKKYNTLCEFWVKGLRINWTDLYKDGNITGGPLRRVSLPTYPFAKERYWIPAPDRNEEILPAPGSIEKRTHGEETAMTGTVLLQPYWSAQVAQESIKNPHYTEYVVFFAGTCQAFNRPEQPEGFIPGARCIYLNAQKEDLNDEFQEYAVQLFNEIKSLLKRNVEGKILVQVVVSANTGILSSLYAILKTARLENPRITGQLIETEDRVDHERIISILKENAANKASIHVRYLRRKREVMMLREYMTSGTISHAPWKKDGTYLITGGAGGLGLIVGKEIVRQAKSATVIFVGRSALSPEKQREINLLNDSGATVEYRQADVSIKDTIVSAIDGILRDFGRLDGIIHCAGVTRDSFLIHKTTKEWQEVYAPKVMGLINLDNASKDIPLDFFVLFSSIASVLGNPGQADYASANAFMDAYAVMRNSMVAKKERMGHTISINWPLWREGGMKVEKDVEENLLERNGFLAIDTPSALQAFYEAIAAPCDQLAVVYGNKNKIIESLTCSQNSESSGVAAIENLILSDKQRQLLSEKTLWNVKILFGQTIKLAPDRIDELEEFHAYGLSSVMIVKLNNILEGIFGEISKTLFFEYPNLSRLTAYFVKDHPAACIKWTGMESTFLPEIPSAKLSPTTREHESLTVSDRLAKFESAIASQPVPSNGQVPVAIIGMSGRYPMSPSLPVYWDNLKTGKDCISEIPHGRWNMKDFFQSDKVTAVETARSYSKWGGFLDDFADFDPLFFAISPREAISIDPQERIFLQACWHVLEDAGYTLERVMKKYNGNIGVFAGVTKTGFELYSPELWRHGSEHRLRTSFSSVANRVSYHLNLCGPSLAIDTMCSASLTAIHEACENLLRGSCAMAIAGGVNLYLHPLNYIDLCSQSFLSTDGKCRSFGNGGDGFVPGEGVGAVLLKPLPQAIADGDNIYAIIKATGINHGGKTSGYTVPNPAAQAELIRKTLDKAGVNARTISYVEAHGTGTSLGDPIEVTGLSKAFREDTRDVQFCAIGSAKSNIGHLEAAAGIAGVAKVVLQMKYGMLAPSLHAGDLNANINFTKSPFFVQRELTEWNRPFVNQNGNETETPRVASVSSFGAGGSNAHVIIQEYIPAESLNEENVASVERRIPALIILSARDQKGLQRQANQLIRFITRKEFSDTYENLLNTAYTLQTGREPMEERLALCVHSVAELIEKLTAYVKGESGHFFQDRALDRLEILRDTESGIPVSSMINSWLESEDFDKILSTWVKGHFVEWEKLYSAQENTPQFPRRISLPVYPFAKTPYWLPQLPADKGIASSIPSALMEDTFKNKQELPNQKEPVKEWIFSKEEWIERQAAEDINWKECLGRQSQKNICIIYQDKSDSEGLITLLDKLRQAAGLKHPLHINTMHVSELNAAVLKQLTIDVVLFLGPGKVFDSSVEPVESDLSHVFMLSKGLMQATWSDPVRIYYLFETCDSNRRLDCEALSGFLRSAMKENDQHVWRTIRLHNVENTSVRHQLFLREWLSEEERMKDRDQFLEVQYREGKRFSKKLVETELKIHSLASFRKNGNYLIAGGMGYIGGLLLQELAEKYNANLIVVSKSPYDEARRKQCEELERYGARVYYHVCDITDRQALQRLYTRIKNEVGNLHGVINLARAHDSKGIVSKSWDSFYEVCQVKIAGTINLDLLTKDEPLDIFMLFASIGAYGARGDSDYAFSVAFQNAFARYRNELKKQGKRTGTSISQCWGPWEEDKLFPESRKKMESLGLDLINMKSAFPLIEASHSYPDSVLGICAVVNRKKVREILGLDEQDTAEADSQGTGKFESLIAQWEQEKKKGRSIGVAEIQRFISAAEMKYVNSSLVDRIYDLCFVHERSPQSKRLFPSEGSENESVTCGRVREEEVFQLIRRSASEVLHVDKIDESKAFQQYGLDSIMAMKLAMKIGKALDMEILPHWFIEFPTIKELTQHVQLHQSRRETRSNERESRNETAWNARAQYIKIISEVVCAVFQIEELDTEKPLQDYGMDSIMAMRLSVSLEKKLKCEVKPNLLLEFPTVNQLAHHLTNVNQQVLI